MRRQHTPYLNPQPRLIRTRGTAVSLNGTTGTTFTGLSGLDRVEIMFDSVSLDDTDNILIQIGDSGGLETTGYVSASGKQDVTAGGAASEVSSTAGFIVLNGAAAVAASGMMVLARIDGNTWVASHGVANDASARVIHGAGVKTLSGELDRVAILDTGGDNFDGSSKINIQYEESKR